MGQKKCAAKCGTQDYFKDTVCDDENNNCGCGWDGGDCCGDTGNKNQYGYCKLCKCLDPNDVNHGEEKCIGVCGSPAWKGDGVCDAANNNCGCKWDLGDCCEKTNIKKNKDLYQYCGENKDLCKCLDPKNSGR